jgi:hypothetical protein
MKTGKTIAGLAFTSVMIGMILASESDNCDAAIVYPKAPEDGERTVRKNLDSKFLEVSRNEDVTTGAPYRAYYVGLTNLAAGQLLSAAKPNC